MIIVSDLDGSLLDHHSYSFEPARPLLKWLDFASVPVVLCTSKTHSEVLSLRQTLGNDSPFIVENGAAVYLPKSEFHYQPEGTEGVGDFWCKTFCQRREHWLKLLEEAKLHFDLDGKLEHFAEMSAERVAEVTGLDVQLAAQAKEREFGEPLRWLGTEEELLVFSQWFRDRGANVLHGGRFVHLAGDADKGRAMTWLVKQYQLQKRESQQHQFRVQHHHPSFQQHFQNQQNGVRTLSIALGDSQNDVAMLECADRAVVIRSPSHEPPKLSRKHGYWVSESTGPMGWTEGINHWLEELQSQGEIELFSV
nr:HAD-IIB family hydrolase [Aestuariicella hydrocarbonica]